MGTVTIRDLSESVAVTGFCEVWGYQERNLSWGRFALNSAIFIGGPCLGGRLSVSLVYVRSKKLFIYRDSPRPKFKLDKKH